MPHVNEKFVYGFQHKMVNQLSMYVFDEAAFLDWQAEQRRDYRDHYRDGDYGQIRRRPTLLQPSHMEHDR